MTQTRSDTPELDQKYLKIECQWSYKLAGAASKCLAGKNCNCCICNVVILTLIHPRVYSDRSACHFPMIGNEAISLARM